MATMTAEELRNVSPREMQLMDYARIGLTCREIAEREGRSVKAVERAFERLRGKLRRWGGGTKPGLVHWIDVYEPAWHQAAAAGASGGSDHLEWLEDRSGEARSARG